MVSGSLLLQLIFSGLSNGAVYALIATGFVVIYNIRGIINFAQGEFVAIGALLASSLLMSGFPYFVAVLLAIVATALLGASIDLLAIRPARRSNEVTLIIITIGISMFLRGLAIMIWGTQTYSLPPFTPLNAIQIFGASIALQEIWILVTMAVVMFFLYVLFDRTVLGSAMRAAMSNPLGSRLIGINTSSMSTIAFVISGALGAVGGISLTPISLATYNMGLMLGLKGFVAMVLGGMVSIPGAVAGAFLLGILESLSSGLLSSAFRDAIAFFILILVLVFRPHGLFRRGGTERV